jgi:hypothetical protein
MRFSFKSLEKYEFSIFCVEKYTVIRPFFISGIRQYIWQVKSQHLAGCLVTDYPDGYKVHPSISEAQDNIPVLVN